jgi:hypothetical protein
MKPLSDTQRVILSQASQHEQRLATPPKSLPAAARDAVVRSLLKQGLLAECAAPREHLGAAWRQGEDGTPIALRITDAGLQAIGVEMADENTVAPAGTTESASDVRDPEAASLAGTQAEEGASTSPAASASSSPAGRLRVVAQQVLAAWENDANQRSDLPAAIEALRQALSKPVRATPRRDTTPRAPRQGTKQEAVRAMLRRPEGATVAQIAEATCWAPHTVRGFFAGLKKKGITVAALERVRQVGPNKDGAKGSYTIYHIAS